MVERSAVEPPCRLSVDNRQIARVARVRKSANARQPRRLRHVQIVRRSERRALAAVENVVGTEIVHDGDSRQFRQQFGMKNLHGVRQIVARGGRRTMRARLPVQTYRRDVFRINARFFQDVRHALRQQFRVSRDNARKRQVRHDVVNGEIFLLKQSRTLRIPSFSAGG